MAIPSHITPKSGTCFPQMARKDIVYLNKLADTSQYPAAQCNMRDDVYMYHRQAPAGAESMNAANFSIRQRTSIDLNNAMLLLIELECKRYRKQQAEAWNHDSVLTSRGNLEFDESFNDLNHTQFRITVTERQDVWVCSVKRIDTGLRTCGDDTKGACARVTFWPVHLWH